MEEHINTISIDRLCASFARIMGADAPAQAAPPHPELDAFVETALDGAQADRLFLFNPDAVAQWLVEKYPYLLREVTQHTQLRLPLVTVMPSVTPVCFGTMYTGAQPAVHGIRKYEKPVITLDTLFDAVLRSGKKAAIVADRDSSLAHIYNERNMDYYFYDTVEEVNAAACDLIREDRYDLLVVYNKNYDSIMHKFGPESPEALGELRYNAAMFAVFARLIEKHWKGHNTILGFATDHGCHAIDQGCGSHGLDMEEDLNILHFYGARKATEK